MYRKFGKRIVDLSLTIPALIILLPIMAVIALLIAIKLGRPVLFTQQRPGLKGKPFMMMKFRSMTNARDEAGELLSDEDRVTPLGIFLRNSSLDELPELFNVLKGEMSLVGPRPLLMEYLELYSPEQNRRHETAPGITGWAQVNGRATISHEEKFIQDVWYVDNQSLWLDLRILYKTIITVIKKENTCYEGMATGCPQWMTDENGLRSVTENAQQHKQDQDD